ncbi:hypothetical protein F5Y10DRAFT_263493 [Nemania abortiva]|nr:hypothetical protein F5Y10DRAFT_263493 [Nemania abortiva]
MDVAESHSGALTSKDDQLTARYWKNIFDLPNGTAAEPQTPRKAKAVVKHSALISIPTNFAEWQDKLYKILLNNVVAQLDEATAAIPTPVNHGGMHPSVHHVNDLQSRFEEKSIIVRNRFQALRGEIRMALGPHLGGESRTLIDAILSKYEALLQASGRTLANEAEIVVDGMFQDSLRFPSLGRDWFLTPSDLLVW